MVSMVSLMFQWLPSGFNGFLDASVAPKGVSMAPLMFQWLPSGFNGVSSMFQCTWDILMASGRFY